MQSPPPRYHVHNSYIWLGSIRAAIYVFFAILVSIASSIGSIINGINAADPDFMEDMSAITLIIALVAVGFVVIMALIVGIQAWSWRHLYYEMGPEEFSLYSGILNKKRVHVPYQRIQSVDQKASLLQRIFGVCTLSIDTAGGASNKAIQVPYLRKGVADSLRKELFARKQCAIDGVPVVNQSAASNEGNVLDAGEQIWEDLGGVFAGQVPEMETATYEYSLTNKELIFTGLSNNSGFMVAAIIVLVGILQFAGEIFNLFPSAEDAVTDTMLSATWMFGIENVAAIVAIIVVGCTLVVWVISIISACIQYGGFHARRRGGRIEVERGLLQHQTQGVSIDRIQCVVVKQSFIRKLIGYCELSLGKIDAKGDGSDPENKGKSLAEEGIIVHPFLKLSRVNEVVSGLVPEFADIPETDISLSKVALRRGLIRRCIWQGGGFWLTVICAAFLLGFNFIVETDPEFVTDAEEAAIVFAINMILYVMIGLGILLFVIGIIGTFIWARNSSFAVNRRFIRITNGGLSTESTMLPKSKVQYAFTRQNPLQRIAKTTTLCARTAAGIGGTTFTLIDISTDDAKTYLDWIKPIR